MLAHPLRNLRLRVRFSHDRKRTGSAVEVRRVLYHLRVAGRTEHDLPGSHIVLQGHVTITTKGETRTYRKGDRCDVPANTVHSAVMGPQGCRYLIGER